jgi:hypothetical protein
MIIQSLTNLVHALHFLFKELALIKIIWRISNASFCTTYKQRWLPFHFQRTIQMFYTVPFSSSKIQLRIVYWYLCSSQATMFHNSVPFFIHFKCSQINSNFSWHLKTPTDITDILTDILQCTKSLFHPMYEWTFMWGHICTYQVHKKKKKKKKKSSWTMKTLNKNSL